MPRASKPKAVAQAEAQAPVPVPVATPAAPAPVQEQDTRSPLHRATGSDELDFGHFRGLGRRSG